LFTLYDLLILVLLIAKATGGHEFNIAWLVIEVSAV
jgi:hypothetical protein